MAASEPFYDNDNGGDNDDDEKRTSRYVRLLECRR